MIGFWLGAAALTLLALILMLAPMWRQDGNGNGNGKKNLSVLLPVIAIVPVSLGLYQMVTTYEAHDEAGWRRIGNEYRDQGNLSRARMAYAEAWQLADSPDNEFKLSYAETLLFTDPETATGLAGDLIEQVLASAPTDPAALFFGGIVAIERGQTAEAAERLMAFLATNPPPDVANLVRNQLMAMAGSPVAATVTGSQTTVSQTSGTVIDLEISVDADISLERFGPNARVFLFARPPGSRQPIAADRRLLSEIPGSFSLSDANAMAGGSLGQFDTLTVVARISQSGNATEQPGDAYAEATVMPQSGEVVQLVINQIVPEG